MPTRRLPNQKLKAVPGTHAHVIRAQGGLEHRDLAALLWRAKPFYPPNRS